MKILSQKEFEKYYKSTDFVSHFDFDISQYMSLVQFDGDKVILQ